MKTYYSPVLHTTIANAHFKVFHPSDDYACKTSHCASQY